MGVVGECKDEKKDRAEDHHHCHDHRWKNHIANAIFLIPTLFLFRGFLGHFEKDRRNLDEYSVKNMRADFESLRDKKRLNNVPSLKIKVNLARGKNGTLSDLRKGGRHFGISQEGVVFVEFPATYLI